MNMWVSGGEGRVGPSSHAPEKGLQTGHQDTGLSPLCAIRQSSALSGPVSPLVQFSLAPTDRLLKTLAGRCEPEATPFCPEPWGLADGAVPRVPAR